MSRKNRREWMKLKKNGGMDLINMLLRAQSLMQKVTFGKSARKPRTKVEVNGIVRITPGKRHAWVDTNVGLIRKPLGTF